MEEEEEEEVAMLPQDKKNQTNTLQETQKKKIGPRRNHMERSHERRRSLVCAERKRSTGLFLHKQHRLISFIPGRWRRSGRRVRSAAIRKHAARRVTLMGGELLGGKTMKSISKRSSMVSSSPVWRYARHMSCKMRGVT